MENKGFDHRIVLDCRVNTKKQMIVNLVHGEGNETAKTSTLIFAICEMQATLTDLYRQVRDGDRQSILEKFQK